MNNFTFLTDILSWMVVLISELNLNWFAAIILNIVFAINSVLQCC